MEKSPCTRLHFKNYIYQNYFCKWCPTHLSSLAKKLAYNFFLLNGSKKLGQEILCQRQDLLARQYPPPPPALQKKTAYQVWCVSEWSSRLETWLRRCSFLQSRCGLWSRLPGTWNFLSLGGMTSPCSQIPSHRYTEHGSSLIKKKYIYYI